MSEPLLRHAPATVHGRVLVQPASGGHARVWLVGFHGYAQSAALFLPGLVSAATRDDVLVASVQALHPFYTKRDEVVANWMTREDRELAIADNTAYADAVLDQLAHEFGEPGAILYAGFSQGVAQAYRAALNGRRAAHTLFTVGGDTPPELHGGGRQPWPRVMMLTGRDDAWYTPARLAEDAARLRAAGTDVREQVFAGGHEWSDDVVGALRELLVGIG